MANLRGKNLVVELKCLKVISHPFKALVLPTFSRGAKDLRGGGMKISYRKVYKTGEGMHMMTRVKMHLSTSYHILLVEYGELPMELNALKLH